MESPASLFSSFWSLFFPENCAACGRPLLNGEEVICLQCDLKLPRTHFHRFPNNLACQRFLGRMPVQQAVSFLYFTKDGLTQHLVHELKYAGRKEIGHKLGSLFARELDESGWLKDVDYLIPVPLHPRKEWKRGYNQSYFIASGLSENRAIPVVKNQLLKIRNTASQTHKTTAERIENVRDAFLLSHPERVEGKHVLLVDDVLTTGATLEAAATALLKAAKGIKISIATLAIALDF
jgi:ComF family protein